MKELIIVGASGFGTEVSFLAERLGIKIKGFLDDTPEKIGTEILGIKVVGKVSDWKKFQNCEFVIAIGSPRGRKKVYEAFLSSSLKPKFATLIDPSAIIGKRVKVGQGSIICANVVATTNIRIGNHNIINLNTTIGHDCILEDFVTVAPQVAISGNTYIFDLVEIGTGAVIREKLRINKGAMVGMGSVLTKNVDELNVVVGNPARAIKKLGG